MLTDIEISKNAKMLKIKETTSLGWEQALQSEDGIGVSLWI